MNRTQFVKRFRFYLQYFPLTLNFFIVAAAWGACWFFLHMKSSDKNDALEVNSFAPLILMMGKVALWFAGSLQALSVLTAIGCWLYYLWAGDKRKYQLELSFENGTRVNTLWFRALLRAARRPLLGFIKGRLFYNNFEMTDKFTLASNQRTSRKFWRDGVFGKNLLQLPDIKEYQVAGGFVYFEDMLQLVSLPARQRIHNHFYQPPQNLAIQEQKATPLKTEDTEQRIEQLRKVDGEYINYKDFEAGDDVRRIVWKVYAKNRELVVRVPEIFNPYASHIYFFASFHTDLNSLQQNNVFAQAMLNYYKNHVWTIYEAIAGKAFEVRYLPDSELHIPEQENIKAYVQRVVSNSEWHNDIDLSEYFKPDYGSVLCISSMNSPEEIEEVLEQCSADTLVYYVKLSDIFKNATPLSLFWRLFLKAPEDRYRRIRGRWFFSPFRMQLLKREKKIEKVLKNTNVRVNVGF